MEKISVIIPVYNAGTMLIGCVQAVLGQTYSDIELILVNDGSQDGSGALCDSFTDPRVRVFHQENKGVSAARNLGLAQAAGTYITFLDADDIVPPDYLQVLYDACQCADIAVCDVVCVQDGQETIRFTHPEAILSRLEALNFLLTRRKINSGPYAKLFRREMVGGLIFPPLKAYEDILFVKDAFCRAGTIAITNRTEYRYLQNPTGAMSNYFKAPSLDIICATEALLEFLAADRDLDPECFYITVSHLMQYVISIAQNAEGREFIRQARGLYRRFWRQILNCPAFPKKEKIVYSLFICGWLYADGTMRWIGG